LGSTAFQAHEERVAPPQLQPQNPAGSSELGRYHTRAAESMAARDFRISKQARNGARIGAAT
jgi:hypothetical protein